MSSIRLHFLDARGTLGDLHDRLHGVLSETYERAAARMPLGPLDVVVRAGRHVIPEKGHLGHAPEPGVVYVTVDPGHPALRADADASFERMFAHELHHAARWDGPGYGATLGEALVSEGLAEHFAREMCGGPPEPWEGSKENGIRAHVDRAGRDWGRSDYDHEAWFYGSADLPRWLGYALGYRLVGLYLTDHPDRSASDLVWADAQAFRVGLDAI